MIFGKTLKAIKKGLADTEKEKEGGETYSWMFLKILSINILCNFF